MPPKPSPPSATAASPSSIDSTAASRVQLTRPPSRTLVAAKESTRSFSIPNTGSKALTARRQRLAKEMTWWELELDDWFNTYLPGEDLPNNLKWTPFNVDLTSERAMYPGLEKGLQDAIETVGCDDLVARSTDRYPDKTRSTTGQTTRICPDLGIYPASRPDPDVQQSAAASVDPTESLRVCFASMEVPVEVKRDVTVKRTTASSTGTPAADTPPSVLPASLPQAASTSEGYFSIFSSEGGAAVPLGNKEQCGQMVDYVVELCNRQHRLFVFMILFVNETARLLRFDRTGASMTIAFDYTQRPEIFGKFFHRLSRQGRAARGHDPTTVPANEANTALFRKLHTRYNPESAVARGLEDAAMDGWPVSKLTIEGPFSPDQNAVLPNAPVSRREFLIGKPMSASRSLSGRGTKAHVAYDVTTKKVVVIKDSWRPNSTKIRAEYDTYLILNGSERPIGQPFLIPTLLGGGDVIWKDVAQETQTSNPDLLTRTHFRLVLKEVCRPLDDFTNSLELVTAVMCAIDAHSVAWLYAHILHRDVSIGNILILDEDPERPPNPRTVKGLLADWDLARTKEELENPAFTQKTRSGTWPFISARLQHAGPEQLHELSDDLESFVHVLNYCAVKYLPNKLSNEDYRVASFISRVYDHVRQSGVLDKGSHEKLELLVGNKPFVELQNPKQPLSLLLQALSALCYHHYHHIQFALPDPQYVTDPGLMSVERGRFAQMLSATKTRNPAARVVHRTVTPSTTVLPPPDPSKSPFNDHDAIVLEFLETLEPPNQEHPAYGLEWPASDKIKRVKPLSLVEPTISVSQSGKRQSGVPPYAPFGTPNPEHSAPAKRARTCASDSRDSPDSRGRGSGGSGKSQRKTRTLKTSAQTRTRSEASSAPQPRYIDPMALRSEGESSRSRSTTPESQGMFGDVEDDMDTDDLEPDTNESGAQASGGCRY
ncbi:hypothetical protein LXA43DRAFT_1159140 [Ganoderma leucocontextum]|nr:hypothetical protein LXA43DRAFT_1159140 [Ganoderma leucocontextum]